VVGCYIWYNEEGTGRGRSLPRPILAVPNVTAHPSTASVPITVLLSNGLLLCGFNVPVKGLKTLMKKISARSLILVIFVVVWVTCGRPQHGRESVMPLLSFCPINVFNPPKLLFSVRKHESNLLHTIHCRRFK